MEKYLPLFDEWANARCAFSDGCLGATMALFRDYEKFCEGRNPAPLETFEKILKGQGFELSGLFVRGLLLKGDAEVTR